MNSIFSLRKVEEACRRVVFYRCEVLLLERSPRLKVTVNQTGNVVAYDDYDPYGLDLEGRSGNPGTIDNRYRFISAEKDLEMSMYLLGPRLYDQRIGLFRNVDPRADKAELRSWSPYHYSFDNPLRFHDRTGRQPEGENDDLLKKLVEKVTEAVNVIMPSKTIEPPPPLQQMEAMQPLDANVSKALAVTSETLQPVMQEVQEVTATGAQLTSATSLISKGLGTLALAGTATAEFAPPLFALSTGADAATLSLMKIHRTAGGKEFSEADLMAARTDLAFGFALGAAKVPLQYRAAIDVFRFMFMLEARSTGSINQKR